MDYPLLMVTGSGSTRWFREIITGSAPIIKPREVEEESRCILARILWLDMQRVIRLAGPNIPAVARIVDPGGWKEMRQVYQVPGDAIRARIELIYRWDEDGKVHFGGMELETIDAPAARPVRLATIHHRPEDNQSSMKKTWKNLVN
jgi:hypothetical protein